jgi:hypothetical protein
MSVLDMEPELPLPGVLFEVPLRRRVDVPLVPDCEPEFIPEPELPELPL